MKSLIPPFLKPGDRVEIVASARKISLAELELSIQLLEKQGYHVSLGKNLFAEENQFAGNDQQRLSDLQDALDNPEVKMIWFARGGYGTVRILDQLNFDTFFQNPKWVAGYSDTTILLTHIERNFNIATLHTVMPVNIKPDSDFGNAWQSMMNVVEGKHINYQINTHPFNRTGSVIAPVTGGNLSMLYSVCGTLSMPDTKGKILFLEDLDEYLYHIDRMMMNLKRNKILDSLAGLIVGGMSDMRDNTIPFGKTAEEIIFECIKEYDYPVCYGFPCGHQSDNRAIIIGADASLNIHNDFVEFKQM